MPLPSRRRSSWIATRGKQGVPIHNHAIPGSAPDGLITGVSKKRAGRHDHA
jgi:hypothetical protein